MGPNDVQKPHLPLCDGERQAVCAPTAVLGRLAWSHRSHLLSQPAKQHSFRVNRWNLGQMSTRQSKGHAL